MRKVQRERARAQRAKAGGSQYAEVEQAVAEAVRAAREAEAAEAALRQGNLTKGQRKNRAKKAALAAEVYC